MKNRLNAKTARSTAISIKQLEYLSSLLKKRGVKSALKNYATAGAIKIIKQECNANVCINALSIDAHTAASEIVQNFQGY